MGIGYANRSMEFCAQAGAARRSPLPSTRIMLVRFNMAATPTCVRELTEFPQGQIVIYRPHPTSHVCQIAMLFEGQMDLGAICQTGLDDQLVDCRGGRLKSTSRAKARSLWC